MNADNKILVIGGGMSGLTAALEAAEAGSQVIITEAGPYLGGRSRSGQRNERNGSQWNRLDVQLMLASRPNRESWLIRRRR